MDHAPTNTEDILRPLLERKRNEAREARRAAAAAAAA
jgi:hypothetical protein